VADGRQEILAACCAAVGVALPVIQNVLAAKTVEAGLAILRQQDAGLTQQVYQHMVDRIDERAAAYVYAHTARPLTVGTMVFDRQRQIVAQSHLAKDLFNQVLVD
ncbi:cobalt-precorrin-5B (C(1))-methyltransferase, partial [filamentous cyanobacterium CCP4]